MTKPLHQIQQENRKFILEAIHGCSYYESARHEITEIIGQPLTLSSVLLALKRELIGFYVGLYEVWKGYKYIYWVRGNCPASLEYICDWDLTKETLEEQSEETQRGINEFFND